MAELTFRLAAILPALLLLTDTAVQAKPAHEGKLDRLAARLLQAPFSYQPLNVELAGALELATDDELSQKVPTASGPLRTTDLFVAGDYAYVASYANRLYVVDISSPEHMYVVAEVETPGPAVDVKVQGDLAAIAVQGAGLRFGVTLVDVSDPRQPQVLTEFFDRSWRGIHNLFVHGERIYLAPIEGSGSVRGVIILDISRPTQPRISDRWINENNRFSGRIHDVFVDEGRAYLSDPFSGLVILDLSDPDNPVTLSSLSFDEGIHSAWANEGYVYCNQEFGSWERSIHVVDISDPTNPVKVEEFRAEGPPDDEIVGPHNPYVRDGLLYYAYYDAGLRIFDLSDPAAPRQVGYHPTTLAWGAHPHADGIIYVADSREGLLAFRFTGEQTAVEEAAEVEPPGFELRQNAPNPFNTATVISFSLPRQATVNLAIFNLAGQKVATLMSDERDSGSHAVGWDGRGDPERAAFNAISGDRRRISNCKREKDLTSGTNRAFVSDNRVRSVNEGVARESVRKGIARAPQGFPHPSFRAATAGDARDNVAGTAARAVARSLRRRAAPLQETVPHQAPGLSHPGTVLRRPVGGRQGALAARRPGRPGGPGGEPGLRQSPEQGRHPAGHPVRQDMEGPPPGRSRRFNSAEKSSTQ